MEYKGAELGQAQPWLGLGLNKFDLNNGNGGFGEGLNVSFGPTDKFGWVHGWVAGLDWNKTNSAPNLDLDSGLRLAISSKSQLLDFICGPQ